MLVLTLTEDDPIVIGNGEVEIVLVSSNKGKARLGFRAPTTVSIWRKSVFGKLVAAGKSIGRLANGMCDLLPKRDVL